MADSVVLIVLYGYIAANVLIYRLHMWNHPLSEDAARYPISTITRSFRYVMPVFYLVIVADFPWALFVLRVGPVTLLRLAACSLLGLFALILQSWSLASLGGNFASCYEGRLPVQVVRHGAYRFFHHPIYLSNLVMLLGFNIALFNLPLLCVTLLVGLFYALSIREEERAVARMEQRGPRATPARDP